LRQLTLLAGLCELELLINMRRDDTAACDFADTIGLDALADDMAQESPVYRRVAVWASLCRARLALAERRDQAALDELSALRSWASQHGEGRLLIDIAILTACAFRQAGQPAPAQAHLDEAVGMAMFQEFVRPFVDSRRFIRLPTERALRESRKVDRFRDQFLQLLRKSLAEQLPSDNAQGLLNDAEVAVLEPLNCGYTNKEIARIIGMSPDTVKYRLKSVFQKLGVSSRREAVRVLRERGLIAEAGANRR
jgi:LuxR family maltose regulon positive regulatory protein